MLCAADGLDNRNGWGAYEIFSTAVTLIMGLNTPHGTDHNISARA